MIRWKQAVDGFPDFGMTFGNPDFVQIRRGLWRQGRTGSATIGELVPTLESAFARTACISSLCPSTTPKTSACSCGNYRSASRQQRDPHIQLLYATGRHCERAQLVLEFTAVAGLIRDAMPGLDADKFSTRLRPDTEVGRVGIGHANSRAAGGSVGHRAAVQPSQMSTSSRNKESSSMRRRPETGVGWRSGASSP